MGRRALVAYAREDGRHDVHYAHWAGADPSVVRSLSGPASDPVDAEPLAIGVPFAAVVGDLLDPPVHEALYVVGDGSSRAYRVLWLGPLGVDGGLAVAVDPDDPCDDARVRAWFRGARALAVAWCERGGVGSAEAATLLEARLRDWGGEREVVRCGVGES